MTGHFRQRTNTHSPVLRTSAVVLLAHAGLIWLLIHQPASPALSGSSEQVILASVVSQMSAPAPPAQAAPVRATTPRIPVRPTLQPTAPATIKAAPTAPSASTDTSLAVATAPASSATARPAPTAVAALVPPSSDADYLHNPPPVYPRMSRRMGEQGTVLVRVFINAEGRAEKAEIRTSSGYTRLDEAALETVQRWRYASGQRGGQPEAMWFNVPIRFVLD